MGGGGGGRGGGCQRAVNLEVSSALCDVTDVNNDVLCDESGKLTWQKIQQLQAFPAGGRRV